jgi:hypothetical protein
MTEQAEVLRKLVEEIVGVLEVVLTAPKQIKGSAYETVVRELIDKARSCSKKSCSHKGVVKRWGGKLYCTHHDPIGDAEWNKNARERSGSIQADLG